MVPLTLTQFLRAAKTCVLQLSRVPQGEIQVRDRIPGCYFTLEKCLSTSPNICGLWNGRGRWHERVPLQSGGKWRKRKPRHNAWGQICKDDRHRSVHASERTLSGAGHCSGRGRTCGSKRSGAWAPGWRCWAFCFLNENSTWVKYLVSVPPAPTIGPFPCRVYYWWEKYK